ncbi:uncharacterized protein LOC117591098 [Drosophila guanche]|uniref:Uncharacterized protein n=1 Tax=Drosophila guanche TaxID=7266 RepID=A0A3B0K638_DROGU|nr:uncharacterized protein LOC117591098 [Drosophila guanche]SPP89595.1 Hypothetical predicted protein [Drosophila guanche]
MKMVRSNRRKVIEEVYGSKLDAIHPVKSQALPLLGIAGGGGAGATGLAHLRPPDTRIQSSYMTDNDYYIQTNMPLTAKNLRNNSNILTNAQPSPYSNMNTQRSNIGGKISGRQPQQHKVAHLTLPEGKVNNSVYGLAPKPKEHPHQQRYGCALSKSVTQRSNYSAIEVKNNNNADTELSNKELIHQSGKSGSINKRRSHQHTHRMPMEMPIQMAVMPHPPQHQLHQQQLTHHSNSNHQHQNVAHTNGNTHTPQHPHQKHTCPRQSQSSSQPQVSAADDEDKDDDPEEFFELIRQTVQTAIGNTINDTLFKSFRDLGTKIERFSGELKQTNDKFEKLQETVTGKLVHYGEESSRHFRYLCMKSEYDKMFFQHQAMLSNQTADSSNPSQQNFAAIGVAPSLGGTVRPMSNQKFISKAPKHTQTAQDRGKLPTGNGNTNKVQNPCAYRTTSKAPHQQQTPPEPHKSSDQIVGQSSHLGVAEVLGHIQRICTQMQQNDMGQQNENHLPPDAFNKLEASLVAKAKSNAALGIGGAKHKVLAAGAVKNEGKLLVDSLDEAYSETEDFAMYYDESSSCSDDDDCGLKYPSGAVTSRAPAPVNPFRRQSNNGAGDGQ